MGEAPDFEAMYRLDPDPFRVRSSWYERRKRAVVLGSLCRQRYHAAWDPACGTGDLALALASRCARVLATDDSQRAVQLTMELTSGTQVRVRRHTLPGRPNTPDARFDLVVLSELLYYLPKDARMETYSLIGGTEEPAGEVLAVHWRHHPHDADLSGADVTREFDAAFATRGWTAAVRHDDRDFVLTSWVRDASGQDNP